MWTESASSGKLGDMSPEVPTTLTWPEIGPELKARREQLKMSRSQVKEAGGPSPATTQRIENGDIKTDIDTATKTALEAALQLPQGWINRRLGIRQPVSIEEQEPVVIEGDGERVLVAIADGVSRLSLSERRAVLALVRELQKGPNE